jgi:hypothetical protein
MMLLTFSKENPLKILFLLHNTYIYFQIKWSNLINLTLTRDHGIKNYSLDFVNKDDTFKDDIFNSVKNMIKIWLENAN